MPGRLASRLLVLLLLLPSPAGAPHAAGPTPAGPTRLWVFLTDKGYPDAASESAAVAALGAGFPARARARRTLRRTLPGLVDARDLPVATRYVEQIAALGVPIHVTSRWLNAVSVTADAGQRARIEALPCVKSTRWVAHSVRPSLEAAPAGGAAPADDGFYGFGQTQIELIDLQALHALGYTGAGVVIGVLDTGFATTHAAFHQPGHELPVVAAYDFVNGDANVGIEPGDDPDQHFHGTFILGEMAAYMPGSLVGAAYDAAYILCKTEDTTQEVPSEEDLYVAGLEFIELNGGDVATSSLGYIDWYDQSDLDGQTAVTTQAVNIATDNGLICCTAAGNKGHDLDPATSHLMAPGDAFQVLTCGAVEPTQEYASFTSDGPTADGRVKPEVMTMGKQVFSVWPYDDVQFAEAAGTSSATPLLAGTVACLVGAHPEWGVPTVRDRLKKSGSYVGEPLPDPAFVYGWGIIDAYKALTLGGSWTTLPGGVAGVAGLPQLTGSGPLVGGQPVTLALGQGTPFASAFLVIGFGQVNAGFKGGVLVPAANLLVPGLSLNGAGAVSLPATWPAGLPAAAKIYFQMWMPDPAGVAGFAGSNGLKATTP